MDTDFHKNTILHPHQQKIWDSFVQDKNIVYQPSTSRFWRKKEMNLNDYQTWTKTTAVYPKSVTLPYLALGLYNEWSEYAFKEWLGESESKDLIKELGDVCWYLFRLIDEFNYPAEDLIDTLDEEYFPTISEVVPLAIGTMQGLVKKHLRGDFDFKELRQRILEPLGAILSGLNTLVYDVYFVTLEKVVTINHDKLMSRKERGTIQGDGDNR